MGHFVAPETRKGSQAQERRKRKRNRKGDNPTVENKAKKNDKRASDSQEWPVVVEIHPRWPKKVMGGFKVLKLSFGWHRLRKEVEEIKKENDLCKRKENQDK